MGLLSEYMLNILVACLLVLIYLLINRKLDYFSRRGFPYVKLTILDLVKSVFIGGLTDHPLELYQHVWDGDKPCVGFFNKYLTPSVLVLDPALVERILIKDFSYFHDHGLDVHTDSDSLSQNLFHMNGDQWRTLRNKLLPTFTSGKLKGMVPIMDNCATKSLDEITQDMSLRTDVNLKELFKTYTLSVIASCVFAIEPESIKSPNCEFRQILNKLAKPAKSKLLKMILIMTMPKLAKLLKIKHLPQDVEDFFIKVTKDALEMRKSSGVKRNDFVQLLLELKEKGFVEVDVRDLEQDEMRHVQKAAQSDNRNNKLEMTDALLSSQTLIFIVAGYDNTSYLTAITTYALSKHTDVQSRVRQEVRKALNKHNGINYSALQDMKLLEASINEALRLYPSAVILFRQCNKNYSLSNGVTIERGMRIMIPSKAFQTDSRYWPNPNQYDPDRFLNTDIIPGTYLPFGDGPRICIAQRLALLMVKIIIAKLIVNFEVQPSSKTKEPLKPLQFPAVDVEGGLWASFKPLQQ